MISRQDAAADRRIKAPKVAMGGARSRRATCCRPLEFAQHVVKRHGSTSGDVGVGLGDGTSLLLGLGLVIKRSSHIER